LVLAAFAAMAHDIFAETVQGLVDLVSNVFHALSGMHVFHSRLIGGASKMPWGASRVSQHCSH
jgi:hypothetical protein